MEGSGTCCTGPVLPGASEWRRREQGPARVLVAILATLPAAAGAQVAVRPVTEEDVRRAIPVLRVLAAGAEQARGDRRKVADSFERAQRSYEAAGSGQIDPVRAFREAEGDRLLPPGFRIDETCSRTLTRGGVATVVATAGFSNDAMARMVGGCGPGGKDDQALNKKSDQAVRAARAHLQKQGFEEQGPRLVGKRFAAGVVPGNCFRATPGQGCAALPSGPSVVFTDESAVRAQGQVLEANQAAEQEREERAARAAEAAGFTPQDFDDLRAAIGFAAEDARNPGRLDALAAMPGEFQALSAVRRKNLAVYRKLEGEVAPLLHAISRGPP